MKLRERNENIMIAHNFGHKLSFTQVSAGMGTPSIERVADERFQTRTFSDDLIVY